MKINPDANVSDMLASWKNGNRNDVIEMLSTDHPGLTAFFLVEGIKTKVLDLSDSNTIVNRLIDKRVEIAQNL